MSTYVLKMSKICRLCLQSDSEKYFHMDTDDYQPKMQSVIPEINIQMVEEPLICIKCSELLIRAYNFKSNCLQTDIELKTYANDGKQIKLEEFLRLKKLSNVQMDTGESESCVQDISLDEDQCENKEEDASYKIIHVDLSQKTNNFKEEVSNLKEPTHEMNNVSTTTEQQNVKKTIGEKVAERATIPKQKQRIVVHKCPICDKIFLRKGSLDRHLKLHKGNKCIICNEIICKETLKQHMHDHKFERKHQCTHCGNSFARATTLGNHVRSVHMSEKPYICEICGMGFPIRCAYTSHKKRQHEPVEKKFVCSFCGKCYRIKSILEDHMKWHTGERKYLCQVCSKSFVTNNSLKKHIRIHNGEKPFGCPICEKTFTQKNNMKIHLMSCSRNNAK